MRKREGRRVHFCPCCTRELSPKLFNIDLRISYAALVDSRATNAVVASRFLLLVSFFRNATRKGCGMRFISFYLSWGNMYEMIKENNLRSFTIEEQRFRFRFVWMHPIGNGRFRTFECLWFTFYGWWWWNELKNCPVNNCWIMSSYIIIFFKYFLECPFFAVVFNVVYIYYIYLLVPYDSWGTFLDEIPTQLTTQFFPKKKTDNLLFTFYSMSRRPNVTIHTKSHHTPPLSHPFPRHHQPSRDVHPTYYASVRWCDQRYQSIRKTSQCYEKYRIHTDDNGFRRFYHLLQWWAFGELIFLFF